MSNIEDNRLEVTAENHSPTDILLDNISINENQEVNTFIGEFQVIDPDTIDCHIYSFVSGSGDNDNSSFLISGDSLLCGEVFDYETKNTYSIRVQVTDDGLGNLSYEKSFTIIINDVIESGFNDVYATNLKIYPNPFDESTILQFNNPERDHYILYISVLSGKVCRIVTDITTSEYILKKGNLKEGFYFTELRGTKVWRGKIIIE